MGTTDQRGKQGKEHGWSMGGTLIRDYSSPTVGALSARVGATVENTEARVHGGGGTGQWRVGERAHMTWKLVVCESFGGGARFENAPDASLFCTPTSAQHRHSKWELPLWTTLARKPTTPPVPFPPSHFQYSSRRF